MPTILKFKLFGWCWLEGIWGFEGLDKGIYGETIFGALPGAQKRGTWGTQIQWLHSLLKAPGSSPEGMLPGSGGPIDGGVRCPG